jgi:hypothetical protein
MTDEPIESEKEMAAFLEKNRHHAVARLNDQEVFAENQQEAPDVDKQDGTEAT